MPIELDDIAAADAKAKLDPQEAADLSKLQDAMQEAWRRSTSCDARWMGYELITGQYAGEDDDYHQLVAALGERYGKNYRAHVGVLGPLK